MSFSTRSPFWSFLFILVSFLSLQSPAQQFSKSTGGNSSNQLMGSNTALHTQLLYNASELGLSAPGVIDRVYFRRGALGGNTLGNFQIKMGQGPATSFGIFNTVFETGLQTTFSSTSVTIPSGAADTWFSFDITGFSYDPSQQLIVDVSFTSSTNLAFSTTSSTIGTGFGGRRKLFTNNTTSPTGTTSTDWPDFGLDMAPTNDECGGAIVLSPGINCVNRLNGNTFAASQSTPGVTCTGSLSMNADDDVWYVFQASGLGDTISVSAVDPAFDAVVDVYNGCQGGVRVGCADATSTGGSETIRMANLAAGELYYVRVYSFDTFKGQFSICLKNRNNPCLTPTPTIKANRTETVSNGSILLTVTSSTAGLGFLWQQSTDHGQTWTDLQGHNAPIDTIIYQSTVTDTVYFRVNSQLGNCMEAASNPVKVFVRCAVPIVFAPNASGDMISKVKLNEIDNTSTFDPLGGSYQNFRGQLANLCVGESADLNLEMSASMANNRLVWIDFNQDGDFEEAGEKVFAGSRNTVASESIPVFVPPGTPIGKTIMRISLFNDFESQSGDGPCDNDSYFFGEIEEYTVQINQLVQADAGVTGLNCGSTATLTANTITNGLGTWAVVTGSGTFADVNDPHTTVTGLANGINVLRWSASSVLCNGNSDTVVLTVNQPVQANAGTDAEVCTTAVSLSGNAGPTGSTMKWNNISGVGFLSTFGSSAFYFPPTQSGSYKLEYTILVPGCQISRDTVVATFKANPSAAQAGGNQFVCGFTTTLAAVPPAIGTGQWSVAGFPGISFSDVNSPTAIVSGLPAGNVTLTWTVSNSPCPSNSDQVVIQGNLPIYPLAGPDQVICQPTTTVTGDTTLVPPDMGQIRPAFSAQQGDGNSPSATVPPSIFWKLVSGQGTIATPNQFNTTITNLGIGVNTFSFGYTLPGCGPLADTLSITYNLPPDQANAGSDYTTCSANASVFGNNPQSGTGHWTVIAGGATVSTPNNSSSQVTGLTPGVNSFVWTISTVCGSARDTVQIDYLLIAPNAGPDQITCNTQVTLSGNAVPPGAEGHWSILSGSGVFTDPSSPTTTVTALGVGVNEFFWSQSTGICEFSASDIVAITRNPQPDQADAGSDFTTCQENPFLFGNAPQSGTGLWSVIAGGATVTNPGNRASQVTGLTPGINSFVWTVSTICGSTRDTVQIDYLFISPNAGPDQITCNSQVTLSGNAVPSGAEGQWSILSGSGVFTDPSSPTTTVTALGVGVNEFFWSQSTGLCEFSASDIVAITRNPQPDQANAGFDFSVCSANSSVFGNTPQTGTGLWTRIAGAGTIQNPSSPFTGITGLTSGTNSFVWTISTVCGSTKDTVHINYILVTANAGNDQATCGSSATLAGNIVPNGATGQWSLLSGSGNITNPNSRNSTVTSLSIGANRFVWTVGVNQCEFFLSDTVTITRNPQPDQADAGFDFSTCSSATSLSGNSPQSGSGLWSVLAGGGSVATPTDNFSNVSGLSPGVNSFIWTITSACGSTKDTVNINYILVTSNAGNNQTTCNSTVTLSGNIVPNGATGQWSLLSGSGNITNPNSRNSTVSSLGLGANQFVWTVGVNQCEFFLSDTVTITRNPQPDQADAGFDFSVCSANSSVFGNTPQTGTGLWTRIAGAGTIQNPTSPSTGITGLTSGTNSFAWTISTVCGSTKDTVHINYILVTANAGNDQAACNSSASLAGNAVPNGATGQWSLLSGSGNITNPNSRNTTVTSLGIGANQFVWTVGVNQCEFFLGDTVTITRNPQPDQADAGFDFTVCSGNSSLAGNSPQSGSGVWSVLSGGGAVSDPTNASSIVTGLSAGVNQFMWTISTVCGSTKDTVSVSRFTAPVANAGNNQNVCNTSATLNATAPANGTGNWSRVSGSGTIVNPTQRNSNVIGLGAGNNIFKWKVTNAPCPADSDLVTIIRTVPIVALGGPDQNLTTNSTNLAAGNPTGTWTLFAGSGTIASPGSPNSSVSGLGLGVNKFIWTVLNAPCPVSRDTVSITVNQVGNPCAEVTLVAGFSSGLSGSVLIDYPNSSLINTYRIDFGDETSPGIQSSPTTLSHDFPNPGIYNVCGTFFYTNALQELDSCQVCDTVLIPQQINPCDSLTIVSGAVQKTVVTEPADARGWYYEFSTAFHFPAGYFPKVGVTATDIGIGVLTVAPDATFAEINLTFKPGPKTVCFKGYFMNLQGALDSCVQCQDFDFPFPPVCDFFGQKVQKECGNQGSVVVHFSNQSPVENFIVAFGDGKFHSGSANGDSVVHDFDEPGTYLICAKGYYNQGLDSCEVCESIIIPARPNAGADQHICLDSTTLSGNPAPSGSSSSWSVLSGFATVDSPNSAVTTISDLGIGITEFVYTFSTPGCPDQMDTVVVMRDEPPSQANVGSDQSVCADSAMLISSSPYVGNALWTLVSGSGSIQNPSLNNTVVNGLTAGANVFRYTVSNGVCPSTSDDLTITYIPLQANAGTAQIGCTNQYTLNAVPAPTGASGLWTLLSGSALITSENSATTGLTFVDIGENKFVWTLSVSGCEGTSSDTVSVTRFEPVAQADAGPDQVICGNFTSLSAASNPVGTGNWTLVSGTGTVANPAIASTSISGLALGENVLVWTVSNGPCPSSSDTVHIFTSQPITVSAGFDQLSCSTSASLLGSVESGIPHPNTVIQWTLLSGTGQIANPAALITSASNLGIGENTFILTLTQPGCGAVSDTVIKMREPQTEQANAGADQNLCNNSTQLSGNLPAEHLGTWSVLSGSGQIEFPDSESTSAVNLSVGINEFIWTLSTLCGTTKDTVSFIYQPLISLAGPDQTVCGSQVLLSGNSPQQFGSSHWRKIQGAGFINQPNDAQTLVTGLALGLNVFVYSLEDKECNSEPDTVQVISMDTVATPFAGADQALCNQTIANLEATPITVGSGLWTVVSGNGLVSDPTNPTSTVTGLSFGDITLRWTVSNSPCPSKFDEVNITVNPLVDAQAGPDKTVCADSVQLGGIGEGSWTLISGSGNIVSPTEANSRVLNLGNGANVFQWKVDGLACPSDSDQVIITYSPPIQSNAGGDDTVYVDSTTLIANNFGPGTAVWTKILGGSIIDNPNSPTTDVHSLTPGLNQFVWTITNQTCIEEQKASAQTVNTDTVTITYFVPIAANAGSDNPACTDTVILAGNSAGQGIGQWTVISGTATVDEPQNPLSVVHNLSPGDNKFEWQVTIPSLEPTKDTVVIHRYLPALADAGQDQNLCNPTSVTLTAAPDPENRNGSWFLVSGCGLIASATNLTTTVTGLCDGENVFRWKTFDPLCNEGSGGPTDEVSIFVTMPGESIAGNDKEICTDSTQMQATPPQNGSGQWSVVSGTGTFADAAEATTFVDNLAIGNNTLVWTVTTGNCPPETDTVLIVRVAPLPTSNAGTDQLVCGTSATLDANSPGLASGAWSQIIGSSQISAPGDSNSTVTNLSSGLNQFVWTISNGICPQTSDTVNLTVNPAPIAFAGVDSVTCADTIHLSATPVSGLASGTWTVFSGSATIGLPNQAFTSISNLSIGQNQFVWTVTVTGCNPVTDTVIVTRTGLTLPVFAGIDTAICGTITNLNADAPLVGTGTWTVVTGTGQLLDNHDPKTSVSGLQSGANVLVWSVNNFPCPVSTDTVVITVNQSFAANAGFSYFACSDTGSLHAVPPEGTGIGAWTVETGAAIITNPNSANTVVTNLSPGLNVFRWTVSVLTCPDVSDTVAVIRLNNSLNIGNDTTVCIGDSLLLVVPPQFANFIWSNGELNDSIYVTAGDTLVLIVNTQQNCSFTDTIRVAFSICDGNQPVLTNASLQVGLQPNPASTRVVLNIQNPENKALDIQMFNAVGVEIQQGRKLDSNREQSVELEVRDIPNGVYTIRISGEKVNLIKKLVVQH